MSEILVNKDGAVYAFGSTRGSHYWYVRQPANNRSFPYRVGHIIPMAQFSELYELAYRSGYTDKDFDAARTYLPSPMSRSTKLKSTSAKKSTSSSKTPKVVKSKLSDATKLFL